MKKTKIIISLITFVMLMFNFSIFNINQVYAHDSILDIDVDDCLPDVFYNGVNETWYILNSPSSTMHYDHNISTIRYYFEPNSEDGNYTWTSDVSEEVANEIKTSYANSMKKWNNVYFYTYDSSGNVVKKKIINVTEGNALNHNLSIFPNSEYGETIAYTAVDDAKNIIENEPIEHNHYNKFKMNVMVNYFYEHDTLTANEADTIKERTGAHELGHTLGLLDVDLYCSAADSTDHHNEILMGYTNSIADREKNITYKDIAGVAISRGFHTDFDHKWLNCGLQTNGNYKLLCSICNGVKEVASLENYQYHAYNSCSENHLLQDGNLFAVASYGNEDYYKCKYCKYVASISLLVTQNYSVESISNTEHKYTNTITGLTYSFYEKHTSLYGNCNICGHTHIHEYTTWKYLNNTSHVEACACGSTGTVTGAHIFPSVPPINGNINCIKCKHKMSSDDIGFVPINSIGIKKVSLNGSYILPNGNIILVYDDIEAYLNGSLVFYNKNELPKLS